MKKCVVSLGTERGNYYNSIARLGNSLKDNFEGNFLGYMSEESIGSPKHMENNYAFKIYAIEMCLKEYDLILWLDSSAYAIKNIQPIFDLIEQHGYFMQDAGAWIGNWASDKVLNHYGISRDKAMEIKMYSAGYTGLNFNYKIVREFFSEWNHAMRLGLFNGAWNNDNKTESLDERCLGSRHDMVCASIIANKLGFEFQPGNQYIQYGSPESEIINETIVIKNQGI